MKKKTHTHTQLMKRLRFHVWNKISIHHRICLCPCGSCCDFPFRNLYLHLNNWCQNPLISLPLEAEFQWRRDLIDIASLLFCEATKSQTREDPSCTANRGNIWWEFPLLSVPWWKRCKRRFETLHHGLIFRNIRARLHICYYWCCCCTHVAWVLFGRIP